MQDPISFIFAIAVLIMSVVAHELSHGYAADSLGDPTARLAGRLTLNPLKHLDLMGSVLVPAICLLLGGPVFGWAKPVPYNPYNLSKGRTGEAIVAGAGVFINFLIAIFFGLIIRYYGAILPASFVTIASLVVLTNIVLGIFNLVPIPPLDGSKLLFSLLSYRFYDLEEKLQRWSIVLFLVFVFFIWQFFMPVIGWFFHLLTGSSF